MSLQPNRLLHLPYELRQIIYSLTLVQDPLEPVYKFEDWSSSPNKKEIPALLQVCKQTRDEGFEVFLGQNMVSVICSSESPGRGVECLEKWLLILGPYARHVRRLKLDLKISDDTVYHSCFPDGNPTESSGGALYQLNVTSYRGKWPKTAIDRCFGPRLQWYVQDRGCVVTASRVFEISHRSDLAEMVRPFLKSLDIDDQRFHNVMTVFEHFLERSAMLQNGQKVFVELWQSLLWYIARHVIRHGGKGDVGSWDLPQYDGR